MGGGSNANDTRKVLLSIVGILLAMCSYFLSRLVDSVEAHSVKISGIEKELQDLQTKQRYDSDRIERGDKGCSEASQCCSRLEGQLRGGKR